MIGVESLLGKLKQPETFTKDDYVKVITGIVAAQFDSMLDVVDVTKLASSDALRDQINRIQEAVVEKESQGDLPPFFKVKAEREEVTDRVVAWVIKYIKNAVAERDAQRVKEAAQANNANQEE